MNNFFNAAFSLALTVVLVLAAFAQAQTFTTLYDFSGGSDGGNPFAGVIQDSAGNLYGTTYYGGGGYGVVYKVTTAGKETVLHSFSGDPDGGFPETPLIRDKSGNIYGTTFSEGANIAGTAFMIDTVANETVLHSFSLGSDGCEPSQGLVQDNLGHLYGTTFACGSDDRGTIFKLDSAGDFTLRHSFVGYPSDGASPSLGHLTIDKSDNLYGLAGAGGSTICDGFGCGLFYQLSRKGTFRVLHNFAGGVLDGCYPGGSVVQDKAGNFYGTTSECGAFNDGTIWKVSKEGKETILHHFAGGSADGCDPAGGVTLDPKGNLYGMTYLCGANGYGTLYRLSASGKLTLLHSFEGMDGADPYGEVLRTSEGTLYGTTTSGGSGACNGYGCGTVWKYVP